jgi:hypothetical protein
LLQVEGEKEQGASQGRIQEQREEIRTTKGTRTEQAEREHWMGRAGFEEYKDDEQDHSDSHGTQNKGMTQTQLSGFD